MRQFLMRLVAIGQLLLAVLFGVLAYYVSNFVNVDSLYEDVHKATAVTKSELKAFEKSLAELNQPALIVFTEQLSQHASAVSKTLNMQRMDFKAIQQLSLHFEEMSKGVTELNRSLDPAMLREFSQGIGKTSNFLKQITPVANQAAQELEASSDSMQQNAEMVADLLKTSSIDFTLLNQLEKNWESFDEGLNHLDDLLTLNGLADMRRGSVGLKDALSTSAKQVEKLSSYTYPVVKLRGFSPPEIDNKKFWPDGERIADGLTEASKGLEQLQAELTRLEKELPRLRDSLKTNRRLFQESEETFQSTINRLKKLEPLWKKAPDQAEKLAKQLPQWATKMAGLLREMESLESIADSLSEAESRLETSAERWEQVQRSLDASAKTLKLFSEQLMKVYQNRAVYEIALEESSRLSERFSEELPNLQKGWESKLMAQQESLRRMEAHVEGVQARLPTYQNQTRTLLLGVQVVFIALAIFCLLNGVQGFLTARPNESINKEKV
ncbi:Hypothetical protein PBC10988_1550 [Planctomycetales bacterium 10988]|nr:Hypothetical protein PBC10988_1550 [Planctomycetales bacterium 10988]